MQRKKKDGKAKAMRFPETFTVSFLFPAAELLQSDAENIALPFEFRDHFHRSKITTRQNRLLWFLIERTYGENRLSAEVGIEELCLKANASKREAIDALQGLEKQGFISVSAKAAQPMSA
jgi:hypothetical protein